MFPLLVSFTLHLNRTQLFLEAEDQSKFDNTFIIDCLYCFLDLIKEDSLLFLDSDSHKTCIQLLITCLDQQTPTPPAEFDLLMGHLWEYKRQAQHPDIDYALITKTILEPYQGHDPSLMDHYLNYWRWFPLYWCLYQLERYEQFTKAKLGLAAWLRQWLTDKSIETNCQFNLWIGNTCYYINQEGCFITNQP